jgi:hypothetical protein
MKFAMFTYNDDAKCFHMVIQGTHKFVMMDCINFEDHVLIKRWQANEKMNVTCEMIKDMKNGVIVESDLCLLLGVVRVFEVLKFTAI